MLPVSHKKAAMANGVMEHTKRSAVLHRSLHNDPLKVVGAQGNYLHLSNGQKILDATGGAAVSCLGHGNERVKQAIMEQMNQVSYCHSLFFATAGIEELAQTLVDSTGGEMTRAFVVSSGSEAMEAAVKLARQYFTESRPAQPERTKFIARKESYHGCTLGALSVSGHVTRRALFEPMLSKNTSHVSACNTYRGLAQGESAEQYVARLAQELDDEFQRLGPDTVCAFVAEPVVGAALGCVPSVPGYFKAMRAVCDKYGALLILDEVMSGIGRTGYMHAWQSPLVDVVPDIQTIGKGLGGGYAPVAAVLASHKVVGAMQKGSGSFSHGQTYQGHPVSCRTALEVLRVMQEEKLVENVNDLGEYMGKLLREKVLTLPFVGDVRGQGFFWGMEFVQDKGTKEPFDPSEGIALGVHEMGMEEPFNMSIYPGTGTADGKRGDHVLLAPAYNATKGDIETIVDTTARLIERFFAERERQSASQD
ncbi:hypothetical protein MBLNU459_g4589t1 [Dothideomycetes sp. NU459]